MVEIIFGWVFVVGVGLVVVEIGAVVYDATAKVVSKTASKIGRKASDLAAGVRNRVAASRQQREKLCALNAKARAVQMGLLQLSLSPDFRRAAAVAAKSDMVPLAFRRRQFQRFRPRLVVHFAACLRLGSDPKALTKSLTELLGHLGIAAFESEYIRIEAERSWPSRRFPSASTNASRSFTTTTSSVSRPFGGSRPFPAISEISFLNPKIIVTGTPCSRLAITLKPPTINPEVNHDVSSDETVRNKCYH